MKKNLYFMAVATALIVTSCAKEIEPSGTVREGNTTIDFTSATVKSELDTDGSTVKWLSTDKISVFDSKSANCEFSALSVSGSQASFTGDAEASGTYYALYPYSAAASISGTVISTTIPASQTLKTGSFADGLSISAAKVTSLSGASVFQNVTSLVKFEIPAELDDIVKVEISSPETIAGDFTIDLSSDEPVVTKGTGSNKVTLTAEGGSKIPAGVYYAALLPGSLSGLTVTLTTLNGETASFAKDVAVTLNRSKVRSIGTVKWDYKALYDAGQTIYVCGQAFNKTANGDSKEVIATAADTVIPKNTDVFGWGDMLGGVIFLSENGGSFVTKDQRKAGSGITVAIIGRYRGRPVTMKRTDNQFTLNGGTFAFKNIIIDQNGQQFFNSSAASKSLLIENCKIKAAPTGQLAYISHDVETIKVCSCDFDYAAVTADKTGTIIINTKATGLLNEFLLENNVFYSEKVVLLTALQATSLSSSSIIFRNNSFQKVISGYNGVANVKAVETFEATGNIFQLGTTGYGFSLVKGTVTNLNVSSQQDVADKTHDTYLNITNGLYSYNWKILTSGDQVVGNALPRTTETILPNLTSIDGNWTPAAKYSAYGARR